MRQFMPVVVIFACAVCSIRPLAAQTQPANPVAFLTPAQQVEYAKAHAKALADNPALETEGDSLKAEFASVMPAGSPEEKQAFEKKMDAHRQKLREAMLKEDPALKPVFSEIDQHLSALKRNN